MHYLKYKYVNRLLVVALLAVLLVLSGMAPSLLGPHVVQRVGAATTCRDGSPAPDGDPRQCPPGANSPAGDRKDPGNFEADCKSDTLNKDNCGIIAKLLLFIQVLSGLVGVIIVIMITFGGIQYAAAREDPAAVTSAKKRIQNALIALVLYIFMFAILQWLVPGGIA